MSFEEGKLIAQFLGMCLQGEKGKERFQWFDFTAETWEKISPVVQDILPEFEIYQDIPTLNGLFDAWKNQVKDINETKRSALDLAAKRAPDGL